MRRLPILLCSLMVVACAADDPAVRVFSAASLTEAFELMAQDSAVDVRLSFGPSGGLATQILEGAPADVFASADQRWMDVVARGRGITEQVVFATNGLAVIMPADNPGGVSALEDLARPGLRLVLAAEEVPAGDYARTALALAGIADQALSNVVSNEKDVKAVVQKVLLGEADAGIVYRTDAAGRLAELLEVVEIPPEFDVEVRYPVGLLADSPRSAGGRRFLDHLLGAPGRQVLSDLGFGMP